MTATRVPCTVVTGFLGAGKTTLIRHILENAKGKRLALIVNEFGDVGVDGEILKGCGVESCPEENIVELANGCICCTVADDFVPALDQILSRTPKVDHILIETSGLALPKPLVQAFQWPSVKSRVTVDGVIAVVDGPALAEGRVASDMDALAAQRAQDGTLDHDDPVEEVFEDQVACADLIILSKSDLMDAAGSARANTLIGEHISRAVKIVPTAHGKVDPSVLLGLGLAVEDDIENRKSHHDGMGDHEHDDFDSFVIELPSIASPDELAARVSKAAEEENVLRVKGFVDVDAKPMRLLVQAVGPRVNHYYDRAWTPQDDRRSRLVVIGLKGLNRPAIEKILVG
ncbi:cobalamin biosynthesis protein CobW [Mesorhizobium sp. Root554]|uniref:cobalamin biosynthesis protein CobW n=1 Tax=unclassified Mesorhizobium TaxID=325217 RepID=UPI0006F86B5A|nr:MULTISPECIES: cobalamin biosynthesis protein CobW [unclassified Mesorhizobium]KQZ13932.1 cobalamin biosynthesis protein CobW [Mesorhizobium sp. Root1471]KQZ36444.1 cobalamin biosynthesis protein CobW [Mesorhizobium sp. Root554]